MRPAYKLLLICLTALALRLVLLVFVQHPGISDPNHYYNVGLNLVNGRGYTVNYIWQYNHPPEAVVHPDDYFMPLTSVIAAASMAIFGQTVHGALGLFIVIGSLLPILGYLAARQFGCAGDGRLFAAASVAFVPELVLNSVRSDTTIVNSLLVCATILLLNAGLQRGKVWAFALCGLTAGLAYMTRSDSSLLMPMLAVTLLVYALIRRREPGIRVRWAYALLVPIVAVLVAVPWSLRNLDYAGTISTPKVDEMFFLVDYRDHYHYAGVFDLQSLLQRQTIPQLIGKRLFEMAASLKLMYTNLDVFLPVAVAGGLILLIAARDRRRALALAPALILMLGYFVFYTVLAPLKSQGGSFKKDALTLIPLFAPLAAYALERIIPNPRYRAGTMIVATAFLAANAFERVRADANFVRGYLGRNQSMAAVAQTLPDVNNDGQLILMAQDPFMLDFLGLHSALFPSDDRDIVYEVTQRYRVDYLLMPPDRPALDALYLRTETDPRFVHTADVPGTEYQFFRVQPESGP